MIIKILSRDIIIIKGFTLLPQLSKTVSDGILSFLDARISGRVLLNLNESRLEKFGISLGFQYTLLDIIETLVC